METLEETTYIEERVFHDADGRKESKARGILRDNEVISGDLTRYHADGKTKAHKATGNFYKNRLQGAGSWEFYDEKGKRTISEEGFFHEGRLFKGIRTIYEEGWADRIIAVRSARNYEDLEILYEEANQVITRRVIEKKPFYLKILQEE